jgi:RHS repeat-associated protein
MHTTSATYGTEHSRVIFGEKSDHLGNVRAVVSDVRKPVTTTGSIDTWTWKADITDYFSYYPFGMQEPGRQKQLNTVDDGGYRFGYQGSEKDDEIAGTGNIYTTYFRQLDVRIGRWWSYDPKPNASISPYASMGCNPIIYNDPWGDTLRVDRSKSETNAITKFQEQTKSETGGYYKVDINDKGDVTLVSTGKEGDGMTDKQEAYYNMLNEVIKAKEVSTINLVEDSEDVPIGVWGATSQTIDVGDIETAAKYSSVLTIASMTGHEIYEAYKTAKGLSQRSSHFQALVMEGIIGNYKRPGRLHEADTYFPGRSKLSTGIPPVSVTQPFIKIKNEEDVYIDIIIMITYYNNNVVDVIESK